MEQVKSPQLQRNQHPARGRIGISIANVLHRQLVESASARLGIVPMILESPDSIHPETIAGADLLVVEARSALEYRNTVARVVCGNGEVQPAIVGAIASSSLGALSITDLDGENPFDALLVLPKAVSLISAQLSTVLHSRRRQMRQLEAAQQEVDLGRTIFRSVTSGILLAEAIFPEFPITYVNPAFEAMTGYKLDEIRGENCRFLQRDDREQAALPLIREALRTNTGVVAVLRNYRKDGSLFWNELSLSPIRDRSGRVIHFVGIQNDISERVAFEEALRESEKLAVAGRLAASIAHEINNPLEVVTNMIYLARGNRAGGDSERYLEAAERELKRVSLMAAQSLRFYRQSSKPQPTQPSDLISAVLDVYSPKLVDNRVVVERRDGTCEPVVCFESEIRQVISNLVQNAIDAMSGPNRRLLVRSRQAWDWRSGARGVTITVADTGLGMNRQMMKNLYKAFYTTKTIGGTGLGLWVSSGIVERHHGRLRVRSRRGPQGGGTVFTLFLPYSSLAS